MNRLLWGGLGNGHVGSRARLKASPSKEVSAKPVGAMRQKTNMYLEISSSYWCALWFLIYCAKWRLARGQARAFTVLSRRVAVVKSKRGLGFVFISSGAKEDGFSKCSGVQFVLFWLGVLAHWTCPDYKVKVQL